jgi:hypothetical protein
MGTSEDGKRNEGVPKGMIEEEAQQTRKKVMHHIQYISRTLMNLGSEELYTHKTIKGLTHVQLAAAERTLMVLLNRVLNWLLASLGKGENPKEEFCLVASAEVLRNAMSSLGKLTGVDSYIVDKPAGKADGSGISIQRLTAVNLLIRTK